jgi:hypothetical protein
MRTMWQVLDFAFRRFHLLGNGCFSHVFESRSGRTDRVLKICSGGDDWPLYAAWGVEQGFAGGLTPRLFALRCQPHPNGEDYTARPYAAVVERLRPVDGGDEGAAAKAFCSYVYTRGDEPLPRHAALLDLYAPGWRAFVVAMWDAFGRAPSTYDLHNANFMMRDTPQGPRLVVTDPLTYVDRGSKAARTYRSSTSRVRARDFETWRARATVRGLPLFEYADVAQGVAEAERMLEAA